MLCHSQLCPMKTLLLSWLLLASLLTILFVLVSGHCLNDQQSLMLQLKNSLEFNSSVSTKLRNWNHTTDCCSWSGVTCDNTGRVIGLDLNSESISGGINHSSTALFSFQFLQSLNLANNSFSYTQIPQGLSNLTSLTYLNLSNSGFSGQIPMAISNLTRLATLDLSSIIPGTGITPLKLENPNLSRLIQNLSGLTELLLDGVNISSAKGNDWCQALSSSLPNLRVLSLFNCHLSGPIDSQLLKLRYLSVIQLGQNDLSTTVPEFFGNFTNLTALCLSNSALKGQFPEKIFQVPTLQKLDLSYNELLEGFLPEFPQNASLEILVLSYTNFTGRLPNSIDNLVMLSRIELSHCRFSGPIPTSMASLTRLAYLDLSVNIFEGTIPTFPMSKNLMYIDLSYNNLLGQIPSTHFDGLSNLEYVDLHHNSFTGSIPSSLFTIPSLQKILLSFNQFSGQVGQLSNASSCLLNTLDLSDNNLNGPVPAFFFELKRLNVLLLSSNSLSGSVKLKAITRLCKLTTLDLSYNSLSIDTSDSNWSFSSCPQFTSLYLASCKLQSFPDLKNQSRLFYLDLSDNQIVGEIPAWIWEVGNGTLIYLNLSHNLLVDIQEPYVIPNYLSVLDLQSNQLHGEIPITPELLTYVDYSSNNFTSSIPADIGNNLTFAYFFSLSNNSLTGTIPQSICNASVLQVLDLSRNTLSGTIPSCLIGMNTEALGVLNLRNNKLNGSIPRTFPINCNLKTLDLSRNHVEGHIPKSLVHCTKLEVLNLGNNKINDAFPCFLKSLSSLHVLVLQSNKFQGDIDCQGGNNGSWPNLQIIDLAFNNFSGDLPLRFFLNWRRMKFDENTTQAKLKHLQFEFLYLDPFYYPDTLTVTNKGLEMELVKITTIFTYVDLSSNNFQRVIPDTIGNLTSLYVLNLSHNTLSGPIPPSLGCLQHLESLDLSQNKLSGEIPMQLASLTFLAFLNVSYNLLVGRIPTGSQFQTFSETSFQGNEGLCSFPLNMSCNDTKVKALSPPPIVENSHSFPEINVYISAELGFIVGLGIIIGPLVFYRRCRQWYYKHVDRVLLRSIVWRRQQRRVYRNPIRRL